MWQFVCWIAHSNTQSPSLSCRLFSMRASVYALFYSFFCRTRFLCVELVGFGNAMTFAQFCSFYMVQPKKFYECNFAYEKRLCMTNKCSITYGDGEREQKMGPWIQTNITNRWVPQPSKVKQKSTEHIEKNKKNGQNICKRKHLYSPILLEFFWVFFWLLTAVAVVLDVTRHIV